MHRRRRQPGRRPVAADLGHRAFRVAAPRAAFPGGELRLDIGRALAGDGGDAGPAFPGRAMTGRAGRIQRSALARVAEHGGFGSLIGQCRDIGHDILDGRRIGQRGGERHHLLAVHILIAVTAQALLVVVDGPYQVPARLTAQLGRVQRAIALALRAVMLGETYLTPKVSKHVVDGFLREGEDEPGPLQGLTKRQCEILQLIAEGRATKEIAAILNVSIKTVETHRARLMDRLDIHDVPGLVRFAIRAGLVSSDE